MLRSYLEAYFHWSWLKQKTDFKFLLKIRVIWVRRNAPKVHSQGERNASTICIFVVTQLLGQGPARKISLKKKE
jgi:hypothetical protein